MTKSYLR